MATLAVIGVVICFAFGSSVALVAKEQSAWTFLQLLGAGLLMVMVLAHVAEAFDLLPWMGWGLADSVGHYIDLISAAAGSTLFPVGYAVRVIAKRRSSK